MPQLTVELVQIETLRQALRNQASLKVSVLADALRGTRESPRASCASLLAPLVDEFGEDRVEIRVYHTPILTGWKKKFIPARLNEGWGLQHMKLYGIDDEIILSGFVDVSVLCSLVPTFYGAQVNHKRKTVRISQRTISRIDRIDTIYSRTRNSRTIMQTFRKPLEKSVIRSSRITKVNKVTNWYGRNRIPPLNRLNALGTSRHLPLP